MEAGQTPKEILERIAFLWLDALMAAAPDDTTPAMSWLPSYSGSTPEAVRLAAALATDLRDAGSPQGLAETKGLELLFDVALSEASGDGRLARAFVMDVLATNGAGGLNLLHSLARARTS